MRANESERDSFVFATANRLKEEFGKSFGHRKRDRKGPVGGRARVARKSWA